MLALLWNKVKSKLSPESKGDKAIEDFIALVHILEAYPGGSVSMIRPDGTQASGSPFTGGNSIIGPWGITVDGNDHVWVANVSVKQLPSFAGYVLIHALLGTRPATRSRLPRPATPAKVCNF